MIQNDAFLFPALNRSNRLCARYHRARRYHAIGFMAEGLPAKEYVSIYSLLQAPEQKNETSLLLTPLLLTPETAFIRKNDKAHCAPSFSYSLRKQVRLPGNSHIHSSKKFRLVKNLARVLGPTGLNIFAAQKNQGEPNRLSGVCELSITSHTPGFWR